MQNTLSIEYLIAAESISMKIDSVYKDQLESVYYKIQICIDSEQYLIGRRYNQFYEFDKTLKYHFPNMTFPSLPSKFTIFNKIEHRKKGFNQYLEDLMVIFKQFTNEQKIIFFKVLIEFLELSRSRQGSSDLETYKSKTTILDPLMKSIINWDLSDWVQVKFNHWEKFFLCLKSDTIYLYESSESTSFKVMISLFAARLVQNKENHLELHHDNEDKPILFKSLDLDNLKKALLIATTSKTDSPSSYYKVLPVGRVKLTIHSVGNLKYVKPPASMIRPSVYVLVEFGDFVFQTSFLQISEELEWGQSFIMPIFNVFFDLKLSICAVTTEGWIKQHQKTEVIHVVKIPLIDLNQKPFTTGAVVLPLQASKSKEEDLSNLVLSVSKHYSFSSHFSPVPSHYIEDIPLPEQASMHELKIAFRRMKRIRILYFQILKSLFQTFYWIYPDFSKLTLITYCIFITFMPFQLFLPTLLLIILLTCLYFNPDLKPLSKSFRKKFFCKSKHIQPYPKVNTIKEETHLKKSEMKIMKEKVKEGVMKRWKKFKEDAVELQNYLAIIACYGEKIRNLFLWEDSEKSFIFCIGLLLLILFFSVIPFRAILLIGGLHRFYKGYIFTQRRIENNRRVAEDVINKLLAKHYNERVIRAHSEERWPKEFRENLGLQKKIVEGIRMALELEISIEVFDVCQCPLELASFVASSRVMLKVRDVKGESFGRVYEKEKTNVLFSFLSNVPSEYYRLEHPKIGNVESYY